MRCVSGLRTSSRDTYALGGAAEVTVNDRSSKVAVLLVSMAMWAAAPDFAVAQQPAASTAKTQDFDSEFAALYERFESAQTAHDAAFEALYSGFDASKASAEERAALEKKRAELDAKDPSPIFVKEFASLAERAKGTEVAPKALMQVLDIDHTPPAVADSPGRKALATLLADYIRSPLLSDLPPILQYAPSIDRKVRSDAYKKLASDSPVDQVKAGSLLALATELAADEERGGDRAEARKLFVDLQTRFGGLKSAGDKRTYGALAEGFLYELDHLQIGMQAPDFEATDENGVKFKLSDYKDKVVVVDFWGNW